MQGTIKTKKEGFGFISYKGAQKDIFFHASACQGVTFDELHEGDTVSFEIVDDPKGRGPAAANVTRA